MNKKLLIVVGALLVILLVFNAVSMFKLTGNVVSEDIVKIGVVTPLTGGAGFWGESSIVGAELAKKDLVGEGINVAFVFEDSMLDAKMALGAVEKLVHVDDVDAVYSEFAPAAHAVSSFLQDKEILHVYDAAVDSLLSDSDLNYRTYIDYRENCLESALYLKRKGVERVGMLKMNLEFAELCKQGVLEVYPDAVVFSYNPGEKDFRTMLAKMNGVEAVFNPSFSGEAQASLVHMHELGFDIYLVVPSDALLGGFVESNKNLLDKVVTFGFPDVGQDFLDRLPEGVVAPEAAAVAYTHLMQMARAIDQCGEDLVCVREKMDSSVASDEIGFQGFRDRRAVFDVPIKQWNGSGFVLVA